MPARRIFGSAWSRDKDSRQTAGGSSSMIRSNEKRKFRQLDLDTVIYRRDQVV